MKQVISILLALIHLEDPLLDAMLSLQPALNELVDAKPVGLLEEVLQSGI